LEKSVRKIVVSIVGRPNVGKSTLFNRILRRREAIVDDHPGVTRDRKSAETEWEGCRFTLVDTGGYIPKTDDIIEEGVTQQVRFAIHESDFITFLIDGTTAITDVDGEVAELLRKSSRPCLVVVNKIDNMKREPDAAVFVQFGLGEPIPVSALAGRGIGDMLSFIVKGLYRQSQIEKEMKDDVVRLAVVGKPNAGKSTFVNVILGQERLLVTDIPGTTRDAVDVWVRSHGKDIQLIDTAGMRKRTKINKNVEYYSNLRTHKVIDRCDVACIFTDAEEGVTQQDMRVIHEVVEKKKGVLLVINKWDLIEKEREHIRQFEEKLERRLRGLDYIPVLFVSCKNNLRVFKILEMACRIFDERGKRVPSPQLNRFIEDLYRELSPPAVAGKRIRIMYGSQVGEQPPRFAFFSNYPNLIKESYQRFLENRIRDVFGFEGVPLTIRFKKK